MVRNTLTLSILAACLIVVFQCETAAAQQPGQFGRIGGSLSSASSRQQDDGKRLNQAVKLATPAASRACVALSPEAKQIGKGLYAVIVAVGAGVAKIFSSMFGNRGGRR